MTPNFFHQLLFYLRIDALRHSRRPRMQRISKAIGRLRLSLLLLSFSLFTGTLGYILIEAYPWFDAFYMALITLASVGFGEVYPLSMAGRAFTSALILFNIGTFAYAISTITSTIAEGGFSKLLHDLRMNKTINALNGHIIVCGYGRHAHEVARELSKQGLPFVVVEKDADKLDALRRETNFNYVEGDATHDDVLLEAGLERADAVVITLPSDADNLFITLTARQARPDVRIISRANNHADELKILRAGANHTVVPERIGGFYMASWIHNPRMLDFYSLLSTLGPGNLVFDEIDAAQLLPELLDKSMAESQIKQRSPVSIIALRLSDGAYVMNPDAASTLEKGKKLVILGTSEQIKTFKQLLLTQPNGAVAF